MEKKRIFAAIDISDEARDCVSAYIEETRNRFAGIRVKWEKAEKVHITVKFVGSVAENELAKFTTRVAEVAKNTVPFTVTIVQTGAFVRRASRANVLWLGLRSNSYDGPSEIIAQLAARIDREPSAKKVRPHLTIGRLKDAIRAEPLITYHLAAKFGPVTFNAAEITIYESSLFPTGSVYTVLSRHKFAVVP